MALDDYMEPEVGLAVAVTAALFSPRVRKVLRRGAVYGVAGALMAGDALTTFARGVSRSAQQVAASASQAAAAQTAASSSANGAQKATPPSEGTSSSASHHAAATSAAKGAGKGSAGETK